MGAGSLPHVDPTAPRGLVYRLFAQLAGTRPASWFTRRVAWKLDPHLMRLTGGRLGFGMLLPTALLETRGARTGRPRAKVVIYFHDGEYPTIVASRLGDPRHPDWYHNLRAHPDVTLGGLPFRAQTVEDEAEVSRLWDLADRVFPPYAAYRRRASRANRTIPIIRLTPRG